MLDAIADLHASVGRRGLTRLEEEAQKLKSLVYKREYTFSEGEGEGDASAAIQASLDEVEAQISALTAQARPGHHCSHRRPVGGVLRPDRRL